MTRWSVVALAAAVLVACGGGQARELVTVTAPPLEVAPAEIVAGPMLGYSTMREVAVWVATDRPANVAVRFWPADAPETGAVTTPAATTSTPYNTHQVRVSHLEPGQLYHYAVQIDGHEFPAPEGSVLETAPNWRWSTDPPEPPEFRVAVGSCVYINDPPYDRAGSSYGGGYEIFDTIASGDPTLMLWLGDNVYYREADLGSPTMMAYRYDHDRRTPELQRLLASTHHYAIWDDHDFGPNDSNRAFAFAEDALAQFRGYWANPSYGTADAPGAYTRFEWGDVEFFLLDDRMFRAGNDAPDGADKPFLGDAQLAWLLDGLSSSYATFKIIVVGNQVVNDHTRYEGYAHYAHERDRLYEGIAARGIEGVVFVSGDRHHTEVLRHERDGAYPFYDFTSSPLTSGAATARGELDNPQRVEGTLVTETRNFGTLDVSGPWRDRVLTLRTWNAAGEELWQIAISEHELRLPE